MTPRPVTRARWAAGLAGLCLALAVPGEPAWSKKAPARAAGRGPNAPEPLPYARREEVAQFAERVAERNGLDAAWVRATLAAARYQASVTRFIMPPPAGTAKNWAAYRARFVEPVRIGAGVAFWRANARWLERAEQVYGVPPEVVVGILGVETIYGRQMGGYRAIDALATLAFDFPPGRKDRSDFFRDELEQLLLLCRGAARRETCDPLALRSSYAGALGMPQFMPSSVNRYAVDFDDDGRIDLRESAPDVIGSVAHYLAAFGWQRGMATHFEVAAPVDASDRARLLVPDIVPTFSAQEFADLGAELGSDAREHAGPLALVELQNGDAAPRYVAGTANFYAITRYNWSSYYALAVIELGAAVKRQLEAASAKP